MPQVDDVGYLSRRHLGHEPVLTADAVLVEVVPDLDPHVLVRAVETVHRRKVHVVFGQVGVDQSGNIRILITCGSAGGEGTERRYHQEQRQNLPFHTQFHKFPPLLFDLYFYATIPSRKMQGRTAARRAVTPYKRSFIYSKLISLGHLCSLTYSPTRFWISAAVSSNVLSPAK